MESKQQIRDAKKTLRKNEREKVKAAKKEQKEIDEAPMRMFQKAEREYERKQHRNEQRRLRYAAKKAQGVLERQNDNHINQFAQYFNSHPGKITVNNKTGTRYETTNFPVNFISQYDYRTIGKLEDIMQFLVDQCNNRQTIGITIKVVQAVKLNHKSNKETFVEKIYNFHPSKIVELIKSYSSNIANFYLILYTIATIAQQGSCDSKAHTVTMQFEQDDDDYITLKVDSVKSSNHNCLINAMSQAHECPSKGFRAQKVREELKIQEGPIPVELCPVIAQKLGVTYSLFEYKDKAIRAVSESSIISDTHVNLFVQDGHYWKIQTDMKKYRTINLQSSMQIQQEDSVCPQVTDKVIKFSCGIEYKDLEQVKFKQTLTNPSLQQVQKCIDDGQHLMIIGAGGCGKTWLIKQLKSKKLNYTASTACAADLLPNGSTIHYYMYKNKAHGQTLVIDEVSMVGSALFESIYEWSDHGSKAQLILSGDPLQLPPVNDRFFFQSSSFADFAKNTVSIYLTEIKRQENKDQIKFLNNLRIGDVNRVVLKQLSNNKVSDPDLVLAGSRKFVEEYNKQKLQELNQPLHEFQTIVEKDRKQTVKESNTLCVGAKCIITKNITIMESDGPVKLFNGQRVTVFSFLVNKHGQKIVQVLDADGYLHAIDWVTEHSDKYTTHFLPVEACYALTIHKSQGQTVKSLVVYCDHLFEKGMAYVALSRCTNLDNVQIKGNLNIHDKGWRPNSEAFEFCNSGKTLPADQMLFIPHTKKQLKNVKRHQWKEQKWNHIYLDFETYNDGMVQKPYYNSLVHQYGADTIKRLKFFDQRYDEGIRCDVAKSTWDYIVDVASAYGDNLAKCKTDINKQALVKKLLDETPTICAYNGSGFDLHFLMQQYLENEKCSKRFKLNVIYKGSSLIFLQVFDRVSQEVVLKSHDMFQILGCSLAKALTDFCGSQGKELAKKIEFKDEIMYILHNYADNPNILKPGVVSKITRRIYVENSVTDIPTGQEICLHDNIIQYADNDTDVLPILYKCVDAMFQITLNASIMKFLTAGAAAWYGFVSNVPQDCLEIQRNAYSHKVGQNVINTKIYKLEKVQEDFIRQSIKGGRVCPRQHVIDSLKDGCKYNYLDISGMYASIMKDGQLPYGKADWMTTDQVKLFERTVKATAKASRIDIFNSLLKKFGQVIAQVEFEENPMNLEPVIPFKKDGKTLYTLERRTDNITLQDIAMIIASGGIIHQISRVMTWEKHTQLMREWILKANDIKKQGELEGNSAKKAIGKLLANAAYGQTLKIDRNEVVKIASTWSEADQFVTDNSLTSIFQCGNFDILKGKKIQQQDDFITSRCSYIGSFILAEARAMVFDIVEIACPNRYNEKGVTEQPVYGDTDSLVFRDWQAHLLIKAGWIAKENGKLTDELADDNSHWFLPKRLANLPEDIKSKSMAMQQDYVWSHATQQEKRDPANFFLWSIDKAIFAAPKSYACSYTNYEGTKSKEKIKFKGIPASALVNGGKLDFNLVDHAYEAPGTKTAVLQGKPQVIKTFTKKEGSGMFSQIVDSNMRRGKAVSRLLFKTVWQGRQHISDNITVPWGWNQQ